MRVSRLTTRTCVLLVTLAAVAATVSSVKAYIAYRTYLAVSRHPDDPGTQRKLLARAIRLNPGNALYHRAASREYMRAVEADPKSNLPLLEKAKGHIDVALRAEPTNASAYFELGNYYLLRDDFDKVQKAYGKALKLAPCNANVHEKVGHQYLKRSGNQRWIPPLRRAVELDSTRRTSVFDAIWALTRSAYELRRLGGTDWSLRIAAVRFLRSRKQHSAALRECISLCREAADAPDSAKQQLATLLNHMRQHLMAVLFLRRWVEKSPKSYTLRRELAVSLRSGGKTNEALRLAEKLVKEKPTDHAVHMLLGDLHHRKGDLRPAEEELQKGIDLNPQSVHYHLRLIDFYVRTKQMEKAVRAAEHAVRVFPKQALAYHALGSAHLAKGNLKGALSAYRKAVRLEPDTARYREAVVEVEGKLAGAPGE